MLTLKRTYSVSELETYADSPKRHRLQYILKRPVEPVIGIHGAMSASTRGDIIHKMIEYFGRFRKDPEKLFDAARIELEIGGTTEDDRRYILERFNIFQRSRFALAKGSMNEVPFLMKVGEDYVDGKLDMLITTEIGLSPHWEIVDFKTGEAFEPEKSAKKYAFQMRAYALAVAKATDIVFGRVTLFFLSGNEGKEIQKDIFPDDLKNAEKEIKKIIESIKNGSY